MHSRLETVSDCAVYPCIADSRLCLAAQVTPCRLFAAGTPYAGGVFRVKLSLSKDFPRSPPKGFFMTRIFHPNVAANGEICVNTLKKDWKADLGIKHLLLVGRRVTRRFPRPGCGVHRWGDIKHLLLVGRRFSRPGCGVQRWGSMGTGITPVVYLAQCLLGFRACCSLRIEWC